MNNGVDGDVAASARVGALGVFVAESTLVELGRPPFDAVFELVIVLIGCSIVGGAAVVFLAACAAPEGAG